MASNQVLDVFAADADKDVPPPPAGFKLDKPLASPAAAPVKDGVPPPPPGFTLDTQSSPPVKKSNEQPGILSEVGRQLGLTGRYAAEGLAWPFATVANLPAAGINAITPEKWPKFGEQNEAVSEALTKMGLPLPKNTEERIVGDVARGLSGTGGIIKGAEAGEKLATSPTVKKFLQTLSESPKSQAVATTTGTASGSAVKEAGGPGWAQLLATLAGGLTPAGLASLPTALKNLLRGGASPTSIAENIKSFKDVGTSASVGQATESNAARAAESLISKAPGGGPITSQAAKQQVAIGNKVDDIAQNLSSKASGEAAGRAITKGIEGTADSGIFTPESFMGRTKQVMNDLYTKLDNFIKPDYQADASNFIKATEELSKPIKGAPALSKTKLLKNDLAGELKEAAKSDVGGKPAQISSILDEYGIPYKAPAVAGSNKLPYQSLKELRTRIGEKIEDAGLNPDINVKQLRRLYSALSKDMEGAAKANGPDAYTAFNRANSYTKARYDRLDTIKTVIERGGGPEKIFQAAISGTKEGATTFRALMRSLPKEEQKVVVSAMLRRLGKATPGKQDDVGGVFSTETFLTNWNRLSPEAKSTMSGSMGTKFKKDMDTIAKVANNLREGSKVYANPSGTAPVEQAFKTWGSVMAGAASGQIPGVALVLSGIGAINGAGRLMTNPAFVHWVASTPNKLNQATWSGHIARLTALGETMPDEKYELQQLKQNLEKNLPPDKFPKSKETVPPIKDRIPMDRMLESMPAQ